MPFLQTEPTEAEAAVWFRLAAPVDVPLAVHQAILAYASDFALISTALLPHAVHDVRHRLQGASLDHAVCFHEPFSSDDWLFYHPRSPLSVHALAFSLVSLFSLFLVSCFYIVFFF